HTRSDRDWSSDVCSSDLASSVGFEEEQELWTEAFHDYERLGMTRDAARALYGRSTSAVALGDLARAQSVIQENLEWVLQRHMARSEERRVGKEWKVWGVG